MRLSAWRDLPGPRRLDLAIAAGLLVWGLPDVPWWWEYPGHAGTPAQIAGSLALTLVMSVPFCWRRQVPLVVLALSGAVLTIRVGLDRNSVSAFAALLVAGYGLGAYSVGNRRYARWLGWLWLSVAAGIALLNNGGRLDAVPAALLGAAFALGDAASARRGEVAAVVEAAHQAERTRIARELHDVVAHQLSAIAVQAGAARLAGPHGSELGSPVEVLGTVERQAREALSELSHLLGALRADPADGARVPPAPTLADLDSLASATRSAGTPVEILITGSPRPLAPGVDLSGYRIICEALANVVRHSPGARTRVVIGYRPLALEIDVVNGPPAHDRRPVAGAGLGLRGMRERAELYGGHLRAGPGADGGFSVTAVIPCAELGPPTAAGRQEVTGHNSGGPRPHPSPGSAPAGAA